MKLIKNTDGVKPCTVRPSSIGINLLQITAAILAFVRLSAAFRVHDEDFGIGFDLTPAYGASAISYANGSKMAVARVEGNDDYRKLMFDFHLRRDRWEDFPPATVPVLKDMLLSLRLASEEALGFPIHNATASWSANHYTENLYLGEGLIPLVKQAFDAASMQYIQIRLRAYFGDPILYPENSIVAAHDLGLCHPYNTSVEDCVRDDFSTLPKETYYLAGYYANAMEVTTSADMTLAYAALPYPFMTFELGSENRYRNPDESYYWEEVRKFLSMPLAEFSWRKPSRVVLYGEMSGDEHLREVVMQVLEAFLTEEEMPEWIKDGLNATFAGAMGAAEFAKRAPYWNHGRPWLVPGLTVQTS